MQLVNHASYMSVLYSCTGPVSSGRMKVPSRKDSTLYTHLICPEFLGESLFLYDGNIGIVDKGCGEIYLLVHLQSHCAYCNTDNSRTQVRGSDQGVGVEFQIFSIQNSL